MKQLNKRQEDILSLAEKEGYVSVENLAQTFAVTQQTIRRDINTLCDQQLLTRYHGGAGLSSSVENVEYTTRQVMNLDEKRCIAELTAKQKLRAQLQTEMKLRQQMTSQL